MAGGPLRDLGIYCINAARYLFKAEPCEIIALTATGDDKRFREVEEMVAATLRFPGERIANFICSFGAGDTAVYEVFGTRGSVRLNNAYEYVEPVEMTITIDGQKTTKTFAKRDQFAPELVYFSQCIQKDIEPEPSGEEGVNDLRIIDAIFASSKKKLAVKLSSRQKLKRPSLRQELRRAPVKREPNLVHARPGSR
jgi:predicted dehydrogenase